MNTKLKLNSLLIVLLILSGCAVHIPVEVLKPAEVNIGPVKKVAVLDFEFTGSWDFGHKEEDPKTLEELASKVLAKKLGVSKKSTPLPDPVNAYPGKEVSVKFIAKLVNNGHFEVLEREELSKIMDEQALSMSGILDEKNTIKIGSLLGVEALILGSGNYSVTDKGGWKEYTKKDTSGNEITYKRYRLTRQVNAQLTYRIVDVSSGSVLASKTNSLNMAVRSERKDEISARERIRPWKPIIDQLVDQILSKSVRQIAPHYVLERRLIKNGKTPGMKAGLQYAKRKLWEDAKAAWESVLDDNSEKAIKEHIYARYNIGIYYEIHGDLDKAEELFEQCFQQSGDSKYLDARARIQRRKAELKRLAEQQE